MNPFRDIADKGKRFALAITGGGQEAIGEITRHGGFGDLLVEAIVPYSQESFCEYIGGEPDRYFSGQAARHLAMTAFNRALGFSDTEDRVFGVGASACLKRGDQDRPDRRNGVYIAIQDELRTTEFEIEFNERGRKTFRQKQEDIVADLILSAIGLGAGVYYDMKNDLAAVYDGTEDSPSYGTIKTRWGYGIFNFQGLKYDASRVLMTHMDDYSPARPVPKALFAGSFNPFHEGHRRILEHASHKLRTPVGIELSLSNCRKPTTDFISLNERISSIPVMEDSYFAGLVLTNQKHFVDKAELFPGTTFVMGVDTYESWMTMSDSDEINRLALAGIHMLVYPRAGYSADTWDKLRHNVFYDLRQQIHFVEDFEPIDISSTRIRSGR